MLPPPCASLAQQRQQPTRSSHIVHERGRRSSLIDLTHATIVAPATLHAPGTDRGPRPRRGSREAHAFACRSARTNGRHRRVRSSPSATATILKWAGAGLRGLPSANAPGPEGYACQQRRRAIRAVGPRAGRRCARHAVRRRPPAARTAHDRAARVRVPRRASPSSPRRRSPCADISSAIVRRRIPTTAGTCRCGSSTSATWRSSAPTPIELIPPRSDDAADSPHFPLPQIDMMVEMSRIADDYGLDVWIWYPALDKDYGDPKQVEFALKEWAEVFKKLPRIDAVFVPGGDPGHTQPKHLMALLEKQTAACTRYHPKAQMWVSPQGFTKAWLDEFYAILEDGAGVADRRRLRAADPRQPAGAARERPEAISHPPLSRHHAQPARAVSGARLGRRARAHVAARADQPAPARPGRHLPRADAVHHRLHHLFGRLQRRCEQVRLERAGLGSEGRRAGDPAGIQPLLHRRPLHRIRSRRGCSRWSATGAGRSRPIRERLHDAGAVPGDGARRRAARCC